MAEPSLSAGVFHTRPLVLQFLEYLLPLSFKGPSPPKPVINHMRSF